MEQQYEITVNSNSIGPIQVYIIGRDAPEKRIKEAIKFLNDINLSIQIKLISKSNRKFISEHKIFYIKDYSELEDFDKDNSILLNFSNVESFSLVIAEWLASGLPVISIKNCKLDSLWKNYKGFFSLEEFGSVCENLAQYRLDDDREVYVPRKHGKYLEEFLDCIME